MLVGSGVHDSVSCFFSSKRLKMIVLRDINQYFLNRVYHSTQAIIKPQAKTNEAAQKEIEEAMSRQAQTILSQGLEGKFCLQQSYYLM